MKDLEKLLFLCYLVILLREVTIHILESVEETCVSRIRKGFSLCGLDWKENIPEPKAEHVCMCVREMKIRKKKCKKCKSPVQKGF